MAATRLSVVLVTESQENAETFLAEMMIVGQDLADSKPVHRAHRNAVCEAVALISSARIKLQAVRERVVRLFNNLDFR